MNLTDNKLNLKQAFQEKRSEWAKRLDQANIATQLLVGWEVLPALFDRCSPDY